MVEDTEGKPKHGMDVGLTKYAACPDDIRKNSGVPQRADS